MPLRLRHVVAGLFIAALHASRAQTNVVASTGATPPPALTEERKAELGNQLKALVDELNGIDTQAEEHRKTSTATIEEMRAIQRAKIEAEMGISSKDPAVAELQAQIKAAEEGLVLLRNQLKSTLAKNPDVAKANEKAEQVQAKMKAIQAHGRSLHQKRMEVMTKMESIKESLDPQGAPRKAMALESPRTGVVPLLPAPVVPAPAPAPVKE